MNNKEFRREVAKIAIPVALQSMLQSSFSMIDQIMVGQLGDKAIAAVEIAGKPSFIYAFVLGAVATIAGIMVSQYIGKEDRASEEKARFRDAMSEVYTKYCGDQMDMLQKIMNY